MEPETPSTSVKGEIVVVPFPHVGHIFPATQLAALLARHNHKVTLLLPSTASLPPPHSLIRFVEFPLPHPTVIDPMLLEDTIQTLLLTTLPSSNPLCVIVDEMISGLIETCLQLRIPAVSFFTSGAASAALDYAAWSFSPEDLACGPVPIPGLPAEMVLTASDRHQPFGGPGHPGGPRRRRGIAGAEGAVALLLNTCADLERPFLDYVAKEAGRPAWGVGPLLPDAIWRGGPVLDSEIRAGHKPSVDDKELMEWLDAKPLGSVIYVSFGSLIKPSEDELTRLGAALGESNRPFVWVAQPEAKYWDRSGRAAGSGGDAACGLPGAEGMVIRGWAPQLLILKHPSVGGFVSHCWWNSTVEALVCGVPILAWPLRGDQYHNAKLVVRHLGTGCDAGNKSKEDIARGIEKLMSDDSIRKRAAAVRYLFAGVSPESSMASLNAFLLLITSQSNKTNEEMS